MHHGSFRLYLKVYRWYVYIPLSFRSVSTRVSQKQQTNTYILSLGISVIQVFFTRRYRYHIRGIPGDIGVVPTILHPHVIEGYGVIQFYWSPEVPSSNPVNNPYIKSITIPTTIYSSIISVSLSTSSIRVLSYLPPIPLPLYVYLPLPYILLCGR